MQRSTRQRQVPKYIHTLYNLSLDEDAIPHLKINKKRVDIYITCIYIPDGALYAQSQMGRWTKKCCWALEKINDCMNVVMYF